MLTHRVVAFDLAGDAPAILIRHLPIPEPAEHEVRFKVAAFGLNQADLLLMAGRHYIAADLPIRLGYEASGEIDAVGARVTRFKAGDRVCCIPNVDGPYSVAGEYALAREEFLTSWPESYSAAEAAGFWMQYLTAYYPMKELFPLGRGEWVVITAASGGTGLGAIHMARLLGARVIATSRDRAKHDLLLGSGVEHVVDTYGPDIASEIMRLTGGAGARLICDSLSGAHVERLINALSPQGVIYAQGGLSGTNQLEFSALALVRRGAGLFGYSLINELRKPGALQRGRDFVLGAISRGALPKPVLDRIFPFAETASAYGRLRSGAQRGKIIVSLQS